ncbi:MAG: site-specific DNA-methyltransferase [Comamonadaceae bacterium]|nr:MAG: site-specific DNA-methyltransferase [Comamonadaceae bacterium]
MPTLNWVGKDKVVNHHHEVPFRVLNKVSTFTAPDGLPANSTDNRIIHGDNLEALKSLLPEFEGRVKCIYIDPPYNTGNEGWVYNDAVNDPKMKRWLGQVVGKEGEDLSRHDKWLCMMYPRLKLLHRLLSDDGAIFISIDDHEVHTLRALMDEVFGRANFVTTVIWQKVYAPKNSARHFSEDHDYVVVYAKKAAAWVPNPMPRTDAQNDRYKNPDNDPRGPWKPGDASARNFYSLGTYAIKTPAGRDIAGPPQGRYWVFAEEKLWEMHAEGRIWWGSDGKGVPAVKRFLCDVKQGVVPQTLWPYTEVGHTQDAKKELLGMLEFAGSDEVFITPKPLALIDRVLKIAAQPDSIVLDSFAGSGTTAHAVLKLNAEDGGRRRFVLVETEDYARTLTAERVLRAIAGYGEGRRAVSGLGGGFDFYTVGEPMFLPDDNLNEAVGVEAIRGYVAYSEGIPDNARAGADNPHSPYLLGLSPDTAWLFHYEPDRATSLDMDFLASLRFGGSTGARKPATVIIYADKCLLAKNFMARHGIVFKKIPRDITRF